MRVASASTTAFGSRLVGNETMPVSGLPTRSASIRKVWLDADVGRDDGAAARVDVEERRLAAADRLAGRPFENELAGQQLVDDQRDRGPAHAHRPGEIGARDRLPGADQVQDDAAVDLAAGASGGDPEARGVDTAHLLNVATKAGAPNAIFTRFLAWFDGTPRW